MPFREVVHRGYGGRQAPGSVHNSTTSASRSDHLILVVVFHSIGEKGTCDSESAGLQDATAGSLAQLLGKRP